MFLRKLFLRRNNLLHAAVVLINLCHFASVTLGRNTAQGALVLVVIEVHGQYLDDSLLQHVCNHCFESGFEDDAFATITASPAHMLALCVCLYFRVKCLLALFELRLDHRKHLLKDCKLGGRQVVM